MLDEIVSCERNVMTANGWRGARNATKRIRARSISRMRATRECGTSGRKKEEKNRTSVQPKLNHPASELSDIVSTKRSKHHVLESRDIVVGQTVKRDRCANPWRTDSSRRSAKGTAGTKGSRAESEKLAIRDQSGGECEMQRGATSGREKEKERE